MDTAKKFQICLPDPRRAKGLHAGGCPHPQWCAEKGECYYGKVEPLNEQQPCEPRIESPSSKPPPP